MAAARYRGRQWWISLTPIILKQLKEWHVIVTCDQSEATSLPSRCYTTLRARGFERVRRGIENESVSESFWLVFQDRCHYCHMTVMNGCIFKRDTVSYGTALSWTLLLPVWKPFTSSWNQMYASDTCKNPLQSCLVFHSILDFLQKTSFWANFNSSYDIILSYLVKNSIQRNMNRRGEKRVGAEQEKSPSFTKITKEMNQ